MFIKCINILNRNETLLINTDKVKLIKKSDKNLSTLCYLSVIYDDDNCYIIYENADENIVSAVLHKIIDGISMNRSFIDLTDIDIL